MSTLKTRIKIKKADLLLLGGILLFCAVGLLLYRRTGTPGRTVRVEADGRLYGGGVCRRMPKSTSAATTSCVSRGERL